MSIKSMESAVLDEILKDHIDDSDTTTPVAVKDGTEEVLFERKLSYETLQWLAERRGEEKLFHNTRYGMASM